MTTIDSATGPLSGIRVLDLSSVLMGPLATMMLGDFGADVIAAERPAGDRNRTMGPGPHPELSGISLNLMRNKRSIGLDLRAAEGRQAFLDLAATCDVVVTNLRPGPLRRLGLDEASVRAVREDIIYCRASGYRAESPDADAPAYDDIIQSASGIGDLFIRAGYEPTLIPTLVADKVCGMAISNAIMAALYHRAVTGEGQNIEVPMIDVMRAFVLTEHGAGAIAEPPQSKPGYARILTTERRPHSTKDGWINVLPYDMAHYDALFTAGGRDDLVGDARYQTQLDRVSNSDSLYREVAEILPHRTTEQWLSFCAEHAIPAAAAASLDDLVDELELADHPVAGPYRVIASSARFSATPGELRHPAPLVGQQGREVLAEVGYDQATLERLEADGVLHRPVS